MPEKNNPEISVIIPIYNESESIPFLVKSLNDFFQENAHINCEVLFVDDGSKDDSVLKLENSEFLAYDAVLIKLSKNFGSHAALRAGIESASGKLICFNYADLQDPLYLIVEMKKKADEGNDIIWANRESVKVSLSEKIFSLFYAYLMKKFAFVNFPEMGFDIVMFNSKVANQINNNIEANSSIFLQILGMGFRQASIKYKKRKRSVGVSKWTFSKKVKLFIDSFVAFSYTPIRFVTIMGFLFFIFGSFWTMYIVLRELIYHDLDSGWPALVSILMLGFGITNISLGIIAEYLWRTLDASRKRPVFIIDVVTSLNRKVVSQ